MAPKRTGAGEFAKGGRNPTRHSPTKLVPASPLGETGTIELPSPTPPR